MLGIGGMQLFRAEITGPIKDSKLTPRITQTAKALWYIYLSLTVACALAYWLAGMEPFDAIAHSFSTVAIGGFSTHDAASVFSTAKPSSWSPSFLSCYQASTSRCTFTPSASGRCIRIASTLNAGRT